MGAVYDRRHSDHFQRYDVADAAWHLQRGMVMIDINKKYRTRDGREVRIYATDGRGEFQIHGAIKTDIGWSCSEWKLNGQSYANRSGPNDLIEVRPRHTLPLWLNIYPDGVVCHWATKKEADAMADGVYKRIACIKVDLDFEEGEGL